MSTVAETPDRSAARREPVAEAPAARPLVKRWYQHRRVRMAGLISAAILVAGAGIWWVYYRPYVRTEDARAAATLVQVAPPRIGGRVERVAVREGDTVKAGDVLLELDARAAQAQVDRAKAALAVAEAIEKGAAEQLAIEETVQRAGDVRAQAELQGAQARYKMTRRGPRSEEIAKAKAQVDAAKAQQQLAAEDLRRSESLAKEGGITGAELDQVRTRAQSADAALRAAQEALRQLESGSRPEEIAMAESAVAEAKSKVVESSTADRRVELKRQEHARAEASVAQARADLALAQTDLDERSLKSPIDGVVVRRSADPGDVLSPGQAAVVVAEVGKPWIAANIEETAIGDVHAGQPVDIHVDEGGTLHGKVETVGMATGSTFALIPAESAAGNFTKLVQRIPIRVAVDPGQPLRVGESVTLKIRVR
jgi:membrane fusion protein (multidrug efflux system)